MFYRFRPEDKKGCIRIKAGIEYDTLKLIAEESPLIKSNQFTVAAGSKWFDLVQFEDSMNFAISEKMKEALTQNHISGWDCFPIVIERAPQKYFGFQTLGGAGPILNLEALNNYETDVTEFDLSTWDGSDIFSLEETLLHACTPKVKQVLEKAEISNLEMFAL